MVEIARNIKGIVEPGRVCSVRVVGEAVWYAFGSILQQVSLVRELWRQ